MDCDLFDLCGSFHRGGLGYFRQGYPQVGLMRVCGPRYLRDMCTGEYGVGP